MRIVVFLVRPPAGELDLAPLTVAEEWLLMNSAPLSESKPRSAKGSTDRICSRAALTTVRLLPSTARLSTQPV
jgi:hypothetical protein